MKEIVCAKLKELGIDFDVDEHEAVFTIDEMNALGLDKKGVIIKNLFLRDAKGKRHFLVLLPGDMQGDLKSIEKQIPCSRLSFASEERLGRFLGLTKGSVTPLGVMNDADNAVEVIAEHSLTEVNSRHSLSLKLGVHPNINTATVWMTWDSLKKFIESCGNTIKIIRL